MTTSEKEEETFQVLYGSMDIELSGEVKHLERGDIQIVYRRERHSFSSKTGVVFEEISTTHIKNDSFYEDPYIVNPDLMERKTYVKDWFPL
jgi:N-acetylneuraminate synthase